MNFPPNSSSFSRHDDNSTTLLSGVNQASSLPNADDGIGLRGWRWRRDESSEAVDNSENDLFAIEDNSEQTNEREE